MKSNIRYVIITPVRDEAEYIEKTIMSVISQTITPIEWVIVNDGSSDNTGEIIDNYITKYAWIKTVHREDRGFRQAGSGVIEAFYDGFNCLDSDDWEFIVKLDGDLSFDADYFEKCFKEFKNDTKLGIGGGDIYNLVNGKLVLEKSPLFHVRGATKIYKKECWDAIGGLIQTIGWDTIDEVKANMLGFSTRTFQHIKIVQHKFTGNADGIWKNWVKNGRANYISGYHPSFMALKCIKRIFQKPYLLMSAGLFWGFVIGYIQKAPQVPDNELIQYLRTEQIKKMLGLRTIWR